MTCPTCDLTRCPCQPPAWRAVVRVPHLRANRSHPGGTRPGQGRHRRSSWGW